MNILDGDKLYPADTIILGPGIFKSEDHEGIIILSTVPGGGVGFPSTAYKYPGGDSDTVLASHTSADDKTLPAITSAQSEVSMRFRYWKQLSRLGFFRVIALVITPASAGSVLTLGYSTDAGSTWSPLATSGGEVAIDAAGLYKSAWTPVDPATRKDTMLTMLMSGGDGTTAPVLARLVVEFAETEVVPILPPDDGLRFREDFTTYTDTTDFLAKLGVAGEIWDTDNGGNPDSTMAAIDTGVTYDGHQTLKIMCLGYLDGTLSAPAQNVWTRTVLRFSPAGYVFNTETPALFGGTTWDYATKSGFGIGLQPWDVDDYRPVLDLYGNQTFDTVAAPGITDAILQGGAFHTWDQHRYKSGSDYIYEFYFDGNLVKTFTKAQTTEPDLMKWIEFHYVVDGGCSGTIGTTDTYIYVGLIEVYDADVAPDPYGLL